MSKFTHKILCNKCYYVEETEHFPEKCPVCGSDVSMFSKIEYPDKNEVPKYWEAHLKEKIAKIREKQALAGKNSFSFAFLSDIHWGPNNKKSAALIKRVMKECDLSYCVNGGDTVAGAGLCPAELLFDEISEYFEYFSDIEPKLLTAFGNHDAAYSTFDAPRFYEENISAKEIYDAIFRYEEKYSDRAIEPGKLYFYADDEEHKVRVVVLNSLDTPNEDKKPDGSAVYNRMRCDGYCEEQLNWFANVALDVPEKDWTVVLVSHISPAALENNTINNEAVLGIIDAFRKGGKFEALTVCDDPLYNATVKADFTGSGGNFAFWVSGHTHYDSERVVNDTLCLTVISDWNHQHIKIPMQRTDGTANEHAFDVFTIDTDNHKLYATRVGAGKDRIYSYK